MATTLAQVMTVDEFERLPETDRKFELDDGVLVEVEMAPAEHELAKAELTMLLAKSLPKGFLVLPEAMNRLGARTTRVPDLAIWRESDLRKMDPERTIVGGPLIAIEVVSSETAEALDKTTQQYFAAGTKIVWTVYPKTRAVVIKRPDGSTRLGLGGTLEARGLLPGLKIPVASVFALLEKEKRDKH